MIPTQWREEFDKKFPRLRTVSSLDQKFADAVHDEYKSFITSLLVSLKDEVGKEKKEQLDKNDPDNYGACYAIEGHNSALTKVEDIISKAIEGK